MTIDPAAPDTARTMWQLLETVHSIVYFAPEVRAAYRRIGLGRFWAGYFAGRAAPLGAASPELVTATFFNFQPSMVARFVPATWEAAAPADALGARFEGIDDALRRLLGEPMLGSPEVAAAADLAEEAVAGCSVGGRPLFGAHTTVARPAVPHLRLWHAATLIREHRGDGHIAANLAHGFDGLAAHVTLCATGTVPRSSVQPNRGWSDDEWDAAAAGLVHAGLLTADGGLTDAGLSARQAVEDTTDRLAAEPWSHLGGDRTGSLHDLLVPIAGTVVASGVLPFPNPMGLPARSPLDRA